MQSEVMPQHYLFSPVSGGSDGLLHLTYPTYQQGLFEGGEA